MPVQIVWDSEHMRVRVTFTGAVTEAEYLQHIRDLWSHPQCTDYDEIADCRTMRVDAMTPALMLRGAQLTNELNRQQRRYRVAFVVAGKLGYGVGRQYETYRENPLSETRMFESMSAAETWLDTPRNY